MVALYIAIGGALGTLARYLVGIGLRDMLGDRLPYGTFTVNVVGSFVIGVVLAYYAGRPHPVSPVGTAATIGFLGGFTTYSSFAYETVALIQADRVLAAGGYVGATLVIAGGCCYGGMLVARTLT